MGWLDLGWEGISGRFVALRSRDAGGWREEDAAQDDAS